ncbi:MAG: Rieske 2Fe-2S domain-containing protein [Solirubrobacterales bacterium]|nr:Rieske 2Fe-2S domain-containing protein [Solirubrobacterales bacterium]MBV9167237.1 Rieske 2Fe-2S domain-containing protein [Solirubrobacterales bacterium]
MNAVSSARLVRATSLPELRAAGCLVVHADGHSLCLFADGDQVHAVDNRCPHMGFPLHRGTVCDGILTCHWHHARFDLATGGTFDQFADELRRFPVVVEDNAVLVDVTAPEDPVKHQRRRLQDGLARNIPLVLAKAAIVLLQADSTGVEAFRAGLDFGVRRRGGGWFRGLTTLTCLMNLVPHLDPNDRAAALYHGLSDVAQDSAEQPPRFAIAPLPGKTADIARLAGWFREFVEVRDPEGAERALVSAVQSGASPTALADMLFAAATDHRYLDGGHTLDFINKALEALDIAGWERAELVLGSLPVQLARAQRMEEANSWRSPVDLVGLLERAFEDLGRAHEQGAAHQPRPELRGELVDTVLNDQAEVILEALLQALREGAHPVDLASAVTFAAATRIARFPTSNEFGDWDTALHTFTFANAVEQGLRRSPSLLLLRGVLDAAMSVHLDRFLNVPAKRLPHPEPHVDPESLLKRLPRLLDRQQQVGPARALVASYLAANGPPEWLIASLGGALLRENRNFHTIQCVEAAVRQHELLGAAPDAGIPLIAGAGYLAAHSTTTRSQRQTFEIALRLHRGEKLYEDEDVA